ncbi:Scr1 family TA system antitoxin-like transcriptional regulator [Pseudonocardia sp. ICBG601]|uniref:Scr1 family TA system antitoxin-like transcriptional regulator n=1 Tax=Pseudonocardia sp. ICBG601 TaxID=2846759 RepID=UPI001CF70CAC
MTTSRATERSQLGERLRRYRMAAGLSGRELGALLDCDQSRISRIESGNIGIPSEDAERWLQATGAPVGEHGKVLSLVSAASRAPLPPRTPSLAGWKSRRTDRAAIELEASGALVLNHSFIPEVLQTAAYARRFVRLNSTLSKRGVDSWLSSCVLRQEVLYREGSHLEVILGESSLRRPLGNSAVMLDQLNRIQSLARQRRLDLAVLPDSVQEMREGVNFSVYLAPNADAANLVASSDDVDVSDKGEVVERHVNLFRSCQRHSWRGDQAIEFVESLAREMGSGGSGASDADGERDGA